MSQRTGTFLMFLAVAGLVACATIETNINGAVVYPGHTDSSNKDAYGDRVFMEADGEGGVYVASRGYLARFDSAGANVWTAPGAAVVHGESPLPRSTPGDNRAFVSSYPGPLPGQSRVAILQDSDNTADDCGVNPCPPAPWTFDIFDGATGAHLHRSTLAGRVGTDGSWYPKRLLPYFNSDQGEGYGSGWLIVYEDTWCLAHTGGCLRALHVNAVGKQRQYGAYTWSFPTSMVDTFWFAGSRRENVYASGVWGKVAILKDPASTDADSLHCYTWLPNGVNGFPYYSAFSHIAFDNYRDNVYAIQKAADGSGHWVMAINYKSCGVMWSSPITTNEIANGALGPISVAPDRVVISTRPADGMPLLEFFATADGASLGSVATVDRSLVPHALEVSCGKVHMITTLPETLFTIDVDGMDNACASERSCGDGELYYPQWGKCLPQCSGGYKSEGGQCVFVCPDRHLFAYGWCNPDINCAAHDTWIQEMNACADPCPVVGESWDATEKACVPLCPYDGPTVYNTLTEACDYRCKLQELGLQQYNADTGRCDWTAQHTASTDLPGNVPGADWSNGQVAMRQLRGPDGGVIAVYNSRATLVAADGSLVWSRSLLDFNEAHDETVSTRDGPYATVVDGPEAGSSVLVVAREVDKRTVYGLYRTCQMYLGVDARTGEEVFRFYRGESQPDFFDYTIDLFETQRNTFLHFYYNRAHYSYIRAEEYNLQGTLVRHLEFTLATSYDFYMHFPFTYSNYGNGMFAYLRNNGRISVYEMPAPSAADDPSTWKVLPAASTNLWNSASSLPYYTSSVYSVNENQLRISDSTGNVFLWYKGPLSYAHESKFVARAYGFRRSDGAEMWHTDELINNSILFELGPRMDVASGRVVFAGKTRSWPAGTTDLNAPGISASTFLPPADTCTGSDGSMSIGDNLVSLASVGSSYENCYATGVIDVNQSVPSHLRVSVMGARMSTAFTRGRIVVTPIFADGSEGLPVVKATSYEYFPGKMETVLVQPTEPVKSLRIKLGYNSGSYGSFQYSHLSVTELDFGTATVAVAFDEDGTRAGAAMFGNGHSASSVLVDCNSVSLVRGDGVLMRSALADRCPTCPKGTEYSNALSSCVEPCAGGLIMRGSSCSPACKDGYELNTATGECTPAECAADEVFSNVHNHCAKACDQWQTMGVDGQCTDTCPTAVSYWSPSSAIFGVGLEVCFSVCGGADLVVFMDHQCQECPPGTSPNANKDGCDCPDQSFVLKDGICVAPPCEPAPGIFFESGAEVPYLLDGGVDGQKTEWASTNRWFLTAGARLVTAGCRSGQCIEMTGGDGGSDIYVAQWETQVNQAIPRSFAFGGWLKVVDETTLYYEGGNPVLFNVDIVYASGAKVWGVHVTRPRVQFGVWTRVEGTFTPTEAIKEIQFYAMFRNSVGKIMVDDMYLSKPEQPDQCSPCHESCAECFGPNADQCASCAGDGEFLVDGVCKPACPVGQYSDGTSCVFCSAGTYNPSVGMLGAGACMPCDAGSISGAGADKCTKCRSNHVSPDGITCIDCGDATPADDLRMCSGMCAAGSFSASGYEPCTACEAGSLAVLPGATSCDACPAGTVAGAPGAAACTECPNGEVTFDGVACEPCQDGAVPNQFQNQCLCPTGLVYAGKQCGCPAGSHSNNDYVNHLENGNFESYPVTLNDPNALRYHPRWYRLEGAEVTDQGCLEGDRCMVLTSGDAAGEDVFAAQWGKSVQQTVPGKTYIFGGWYKAELGADVIDELTILVDILFTDGDAQYGAGAVYRNSFLKTSLWTKAEVSYTPPDGKLIESFSMYAILRKTRGTILFDNFFFYEPETCSTCHAECASCSGPLSSQCTTCPAGRFLHAGSCIDACPSKTFVRAGQCHGCHDSCSFECSGPSADDCSKCAAHQLEVDGACTDKCPAGSFSSTGAAPCTACPAGSVSAIGDSACSPCDAGTVTVDGALCVSCPEGSSPSQDQSTCSCPATQVFNGAACACPAGQTDENARKDYLVGGDFENTDRWIMETGASLVATGCYAGGECLKVQNSGAGANGAYAAQWSVTVNQDTVAPLRFELHHKIEAGSNINHDTAIAYLDVVYVDGTSAWGVPFILPTEVRGEWVHSSATLNTLDEEKLVRSFSVYCIVRDSATVYFDNVSVYSPAGTPHCTEGPRVLSVPSLSPLTMSVMSHHRHAPVQSPHVNEVPARVTMDRQPSADAVSTIILGAAAMVVAVGVVAVLRRSGVKEAMGRAKRSLSPPARSGEPGTPDPIPASLPRSMRQRTRTNERDGRV